MPRVKRLSVVVFFRVLCMWCGVVACGLLCVCVLSDGVEGRHVLLLCARVCSLYVFALRRVCCLGCNSCISCCLVQTVAR